jgi:hypothetical protein
MGSTLAVVEEGIASAEFHATAVSTKILQADWLKINPSLTAI